MIIGQVIKMEYDYHPTPDTIWKSIKYKDIKWEYAVLGNGNQALILFPGGMRRPVYGGDFVRNLATYFRIIIPIYPRISRLKDLTDGIREILAIEGIKKTHVYGSSFGGLMVQAFMYYAPNLINRIVISNTGTLSSDSSFPKQINRSLTLIKLVPAFIVRKVMFRSFSNLIPLNVDNRDQIIKLLRLIINSRLLDKPDIICHFESLLDFQKSIKLTVESTLPFQHRMLIIISANDPGVSSNAAASLEELYPRANFYYFQEGEHMPLLVKPEEFFQLVQDHLQRA